MTTYKLTYFPLTGYAESIRFLFHYGGIDFEDNRISYEQWPELKPKIPMEQVPVLEVDGKVYHQSRAIGRFLAKIVHLYGSNDLEAIEIDAAVDDIEDWKTDLMKFIYEEDPVYREKLLKQGLEKSSFFLKKFEERVTKNGCYFVGNKLSWADMVFTTMTEVFNMYLELDVIQDYTALRKLYETVLSQPNIQAYLAKRPESIIPNGDWLKEAQRKSNLVQN